MSNQEKIKVAPTDFESLGKKLEHFHSTLSQGEARIFEYFMENSVAVLAQPRKGITPKFKYRPRGFQALVVGGSDGLTILINSHGKITIIPPEGPLPTDLSADVLGTLSIDGG